MRPWVLALTLAVLAFLVTPARQAAAQESKSRGTLTAMAADSITVKVGTTDMKFTLDDKTVVEAPGGATKSRAAAAAGKAGPTLSEVLKVGDAVEVTYKDPGKHATMVRKISSPGSGGVPAKTAAGTVTAVSASSMTIEGTGGGGSKFTQTYAIDSNTHVIARGATKSLAGGGPITNAVGKGDRVNVSFDDAGGSLKATEVRVMAKAPKS